ncbi:FtsK/SpoIIIE domain-containing protein [Chondromyces crocatus]|uniref:FtsK domain-containing protein n=1 Tax=Chondromyces crocatus TaxID=52 RepID=A0A0K1EQ09_CHOCO|nr:FtsK/SpoIIIE domain-containing protein [Chondromyces crocatus]AKT42904.1 uncharacterized protein CMC5_071320 [Chondromyces crocatus]
MPVDLSVSEVRDELQRAAGKEAIGSGQSATRLLGQMFHEVFADLCGKDPLRSGIRVVVDAAPDRDAGQQRLLSHTYHALVGPRLTRHQPLLQETTRQVLVFWEAIQHLTRWLTDLVWTALDATKEGLQTWEEIAALFTVDEKLTRELRQPDWSDSVRLVGITDALIRIPRTSRFCTIELKLGAGRPLMDLAQVALYRLLAAGQVPSSADSALALLHFAPTLAETLITATEVATVEPRLLALLGKMAGVATPPKAPSAATRPEPRKEPKAEPLPATRGNRTPAKPEPRKTAKNPAANVEVLRRSPARSVPEAAFTSAAMPATQSASHPPKNRPLGAAPPAVEPTPSPPREDPRKEAVATTPAGGSTSAAAPTSATAPLVTSTSATAPPASASAPAASERYAELGQKLVRAFREYGSPVDLLGEPAVGPRFLRFEARLGRGVTFDQIARRTKEIGLKAGIPKDPIISRYEGHLRIEVERPDPQTVPFASILPALGERDPLRGSALVPIGVDVAGTLRTADLASPINAHLLVAGTTGSGKTEWLRMAIAGLLHANTPETLRLVLIDPKLAAFTDLKRSPYLWTKRGLWTPGSGSDVDEVLDDLSAEMERRYQLFEAEGVDDLARYIEKTRKPLARIVCFCDEYFALISQDRQIRKRIEAQIFLLGAKARASGIHLVIATQQPSRQVIQGALNANMPCRVGLMTQSAIESRMLLDVPGAERLTGYGDLLYKDVGDPVRLQAPYLSPEERARLFKPS